MKAPLASTAGAALLCVAALGCGDSRDAIKRPITLLDGAIALDSALLMVDSTNHRALMLEVTGDTLASEPKRVPLPYGPARLERRNGENEALVLSRGRRASSSADAEPGVLSAIEADGDVREYVLGNPFDSLTQSSDGRYVFLLKTNSADRLLENPNEVAIVDLDAKPSEDDAVTTRTLRSFGDSPKAVWFSPTMQILGEPRRLAVVLSERNVTLIDLNHLDRQETTVQLAAPTAAAVSPVQVVFDDDDPVLYVRGSGTDDLFVFDLNERPVDGSADDGVARNDFRPSLNQLGVGSNPSDMALYETGDGPRLLTIAELGRAAVIVEASTSRVTRVELPASAARIVLFEASSPRDDEVAQRALLYAEGSATLTFLDLENVEERGTRNLDTLALQRTVQRLMPMGDERLVLVIHEDSSVSLVDLADRTVSPISTSVDSLYDAMFDAANAKLWVAPENDVWVGSLDLATGQPSELLLDAPVGQAVPMFDDGLLAIVHPSSAGYVTVIDVERPDREHARSVRGFLWSDLLDRGEP